MWGKTKHIDLQYWLIFHHIMKKDTEVEFIAGKNMLADCLTKPISVLLIIRMCQRLVCVLACKMIDSVDPMA
jgi:hypothetical protein